MFGPVSLNINLRWNWYLRFTPFISLNYDPSLMIISSARGGANFDRFPRFFGPDNGGPTSLENRLFDLRYVSRFNINTSWRKRRKIIKPYAKISYINNDKYVFNFILIDYHYNYAKDINFHFYRYILFFPNSSLNATTNLFIHLFSPNSQFFFNFSKKKERKKTSISSIVFHARRVRTWSWKANSQPGKLKGEGRRLNMDPV